LAPDPQKMHLPGSEGATCMQGYGRIHDKKLVQELPYVEGWQEQIVLLGHSDTRGLAGPLGVSL
jgi:hypothetical protein